MGHGINIKPMVSVPVGQDMIKHTLRPRVWFIVGAIGIVYIVLLLKIFIISVVTASEKNTDIHKNIDLGGRAHIYDANAVLIADMLSTRGVRISPRKVKNPQRLTDNLVRIFPDITYDDMYDRVTRKSSSILLQKYITDDEHRAITMLEDMYDSPAVTVRTKRHLYVDTNEISDAGEIATALAQIFTALSYQQIYNKIKSRTGKVLITEQVQTAEQDALNVIGELYGQDLFVLSDNKSAYIKPRQVTDSKGLSTALSHIFPHISYEKILQKVERKSDYVWIKRRTTPEQQYAVNALGDVSVTLEDGATRIYPQGALFSHILGYVDVDNNGISGMEKAQDEQLKLENTPLYLTVDAGIQHIVRREMLNTIEATHAIGGVAIVMNVNNGEVVSMVSLPDFNPNDLKRSGDTFNRATMGVYELGSTLKIINSAMALDSGLVKIDDTFDARKPLKIDRFLIRDYHAKNRVLDVSEVFIYSSNIGSALMADTVGKKIQQQFMKSLNFLDRLPIVLPEKAKPLYPSWWHQVETMTIAYGHGISITPLHLTSAVASLINGGIYHPPKFIQKHPDMGDKGHRVISEQTSLMVRKLMRLNTLEGSGRKSAVQGFVLGGKTGTADKPKETGGYDENALISSYIAGFPMHDPQFVIYVMVDAPQAGAFTNDLRPTGGQVAAPTVRNIVKHIAPLLGVVPIDEEDKQVQHLKIPSYEKRKSRRKKTS